MIKKITLENGLRIIVLPQKTAQTVTVLALVGTGSKYETKEISGISHLLEHIYFKGTKKRPTPLAIAETLDKLGGVYNAFTGEEYTGYYAKVAPNQYLTALEWVSDIYLNSLLPAQEIEKEKRVVIEEINMYLDTPMIYIGELWKELLYGDQPAGWDVAGTKESVSALSREQLLSYQQSQYVASNTIICLAGRVSPAEVVTQVKKYFSKIKIAKSLERGAVLEKQEKANLLLRFKETDQSHLALGVRTFYNLFHSEKQTVELLATVLGGMMSSRLFSQIRDRLGLAYYVRTLVETNIDTGYLVTLAGVDNSRVEKAIVAILKEYQKVKREGISLAELKKAKENLKGKLSLSLETSHAQALFYAVQELLEKKILTPQEIFKEIDRVSVAAVARVAQEIFQEERLNLALIGPFKDKSKFEKLLKI